MNNIYSRFTPEEVRNLAQRYPEAKTITLPDILDTDTEVSLILSPELCRDLSELAISEPDPDFHPDDRIMVNYTPILGAYADSMDSAELVLTASALVRKEGFNILGITEKLEPYKSALLRQISPDTPYYAINAIVGLLEEMQIRPKELGVLIPEDDGNGGLRRRLDVIRDFGIVIQPIGVILNDRRSGAPITLVNLAVIFCNGGGFRVNNTELVDRWLTRYWFNSTLDIGLGDSFQTAFREIFTEALTAERNIDTWGRLVALGILEGDQYDENIGHTLRKEEIEKFKQALAV